MCTCGHINTCMALDHGYVYDIHTFKIMGGKAKLKITTLMELGA